MNFLQGGERTALKYFNRRMTLEKEAFLDGSFLPNRRDPDILNPPKSLSPDLKFGCISVKLFYWSTIDAFDQVPIFVLLKSNGSKRQFQFLCL